MSRKRHFGFIFPCAALAIVLGACDDDSGQKTKPKSDEGSSVECYNVDDCNELYPGGVNRVAMMAVV